jgi:hypothetical protein
MKTAKIALVALAALGATGCFSLMYAPKHKKLMLAEKRDHYYAFFSGQTRAISEQHGCAEGADYLLDAWREGFHRDIDDSDIEDFRARIDADVVGWLETCKENQHDYPLTLSWLEFTKSHREDFEKLGWPTEAQELAVRTHFAEALKPVHGKRDVIVTLEGDRSNPRVAGAMKGIESSFGSNPLVTFANDKGSNMTVSLEIGEPKFRQAKSRVTLSHRWLRGMKTVKNPKIPRLKEDIARAEKDITSAQNTINSLKCDDMARCTSPYRDTIKKSRERIARWREQLSDAPATVKVEDWATHKFPAERTTFYASAPARLVVKAGSFKQVQNKSIQVSRHIDTYPANKSVKLGASRPGPVSNDTLVGDLVSSASSRGAGMINTASAARFNDKRDEVLAMPKGPARDGEMMRWMMFMPSSAARNAAVRSLPPEASVRAEELEPGVVRLLDTGLLDPKNKAWEAGGVKK